MSNWLLISSLELAALTLTAPIGIIASSNNTLTNKANTFFMKSTPFKKHGYILANFPLKVNSEKLSKV